MVTIQVDHHLKLSMHNSCLPVNKILILDSQVSEKCDSVFIDIQGLRSNFKIGEGGTISASILGGGGGTRHFFLLTLYNFKNIEKHVPPLLHGP